MDNLGPPHPPVATKTESLLVKKGSNVLIPPPTTAPGLSPLDNVTKLYIVKQTLPIPFQTEAKTSSHFKIYNHLGEHIFTFGQVDPKVKDKFTLMELFTTGGQLILRIVQRWEEPLKHDDADLEEILPYYRKDQILPTIVYRNDVGHVVGEEELIPSYEATKDNPDSQVHVRHVDGTFLGHIWKGKDCWIIYDANLTPKFTFPKAISSKGLALYSERSGNPRHALELLNRKKNFSCYEYYKSHGFDPDFNEDALGIILTEIALPNFLKPEPGKKKIDHCSAAEFHSTLTQVDKVLVMAMTLNQVCLCFSKYHHNGVYNVGWNLHLSFLNVFLQNTFY